MDESRVTAEWDWVVAMSYARLHALKKWGKEDLYSGEKDGETVCGFMGHLHIPGVLSRLSAPRCRHCCRMTGFANGKGSPKNDPKLRPLVRARIAEAKRGRRRK